MPKNQISREDNITRHIDCGYSRELAEWKVDLDASASNSSSRSYAGDIDRSYNSPMQDYAETADDL